MVKTILMILYFGMIVLLAFSGIVFGQNKLTPEKLFNLQLKDLMNIQVTTAAKFPEEIKNIPASVVLITRKEIENYGYSSLQEILQNIPGLYGIDDYFEYGMFFGVRGFWTGSDNENIIILLNGIKQINNTSSAYALNTINVPVEAIQRIEIIRGPNSVVHGSGAFLGAINIITEPDKQQKTGNAVRIAYGSRKTAEASFYSSGTYENGFFAASASVKDTKGLDNPFREMFVDPEKSLPRYGMADNDRTGGKLENNEKGFTFSGGLGNMYLKANFTESNREFLAFLPSVSDGNTVRITNSNITLWYKRKLTGSFFCDGKITYMYNRMYSEFNFLYPDFYGIQQLEANAYEILLDAFYTSGDNIVLSGGLDYKSIYDIYNMFDIPSFRQESFNNNLFYVDDDNDIRSRAVYSQLNYTISPQFSVVAGIRFEQELKYDLTGKFQQETPGAHTEHDRYDYENIETIPRLALIYHANNNNTVKLLYGKAINRTSFFQTYLNAFGKGKYILEPEYIQTYEIDYLSSLTKKFYINASLFHNSLDHLITRITRGTSVKEYETWLENSGKMVTTGIEITLNWYLSSMVSISASGVFQKTEDKRPEYSDRAVPYSPETLGYIKTLINKGNIFLSFLGNYTGSMETYWDESLPDPDGTLSGGRRIGAKTDGYFTAGFNFRLKKLFKKNYFINLKCLNAFDRKIYYPVYTNSFFLDKGTFAPGRTFLISFGKSF